MAIEFTVGEALMEDLDENAAPPACNRCGTPFDENDNAYFDTDDLEEGYWCEACHEEVEGLAYDPAHEADLAHEAEKFAEEACKVTSSVPMYDSDLDWGNHEQSTGPRHDKEAWQNFCRHNCTNYDELVSSLERTSDQDQTTYAAIRERCNELVEEFEFTEPVDEEDDSD